MTFKQLKQCFQDAKENALIYTTAAEYIKIVAEINVQGVMLRAGIREVEWDETKGIFVIKLSNVSLTGI